MIIVASILNIINYFILFNLMPDINIIIFFLNCYIIPIAYNSFLYLYSLNNNKEHKNINLIIIPFLTTICYTISALFMVKSGKFKIFMNLNTLNTGNVNISINDNLFSFSQIVYMFILYFGLLYIIKIIRGEKSDKSKEYK